jgi:hypothetical protein
MKPADFLLGVLDFFAILLPGALATWLVVQYVPEPVLLKALSFGLESQAKPDTLVLTTAFLFASYMLGHFVFMIGGDLDPSYDRWRKRTKPPATDTTFQAAKKLHDRLNGDLPNFTTLKWGKAYIGIKAPLARVEIDRLEADQKFFRGLVIISVPFAVHFLLRDAPIAVIASIVTGAFSYRRYLQQRWKMSELIYATAVIASTTPAAPRTDGASSEDSE